MKEGTRSSYRLFGYRTPFWGVVGSLVDLPQDKMAKPLSPKPQALSFLGYSGRVDGGSGFRV